jgi:uncharacterized lipoprotein YajG
VLRDFLLKEKVATKIDISILARAANGRTIGRKAKDTKQKFIQLSIAFINQSTRSVS